MQLTPWENDIRLFVYKHFVEAKRAPSTLEIAETFNVGPGKVRETFCALAEKHVLVLQPDSCEIWMAMPFSAIPTAFRVVRGASTWWAN